MSHPLQKMIALVLVCLIGLSPFSASMAAFAQAPAETTAHDCVHPAQQTADHCRQHTGSACDGCAACTSGHCSPSLSAIISAILLDSNLQVTYTNPRVDEIPVSAMTFPLFRPPQA